MRNGDRFHDPEEDYCTMSMMSIIAEDHKPCRWERRWKVLSREIKNWSGASKETAINKKALLNKMTEISRKIK